MNRSPKSSRLETQDKNALTITRRDLLKTGSLVAGAAALAACQGGVESIASEDTDVVSTPSSELLEPTETSTVEQPTPTPTDVPVNLELETYFEGLLAPANAMLIVAKGEGGSKGFNEVNQGKSLIVPHSSSALRTLLLYVQQDSDGPYQFEGSMIHDNDLRAIFDIQTSDDGLEFGEYDGHSIERLGDLQYAREDGNKFLPVKPSGYAVLFKEDTNGDGVGEGELLFGVVDDNLVIDATSIQPAFEDPRAMVERIAQRNGMTFDQFEEELGTIEDVAFELGEHGFDRDVKDDFEQPRYNGRLWVMGESNSKGLEFIGEKPGGWAECPQYDASGDFDRKPPRVFWQEITGEDEEVDEKKYDSRGVAQRVVFSPNGTLANMAYRFRQENKVGSKVAIRRRDKSTHYQDPDSGQVTYSPGVWSVKNVPTNEGVAKMYAEHLPDGTVEGQLRTANIGGVGERIVATVDLSDYSQEPQVSWDDKEGVTIKGRKRKPIEEVLEPRFRRGMPYTVGGLHELYTRDNISGEYLALSETERNKVFDWAKETGVAFGMQHMGAGNSAASFVDFFGIPESEVFLWTDPEIEGDDYRLILPFWTSTKPPFGHGELSEEDREKTILLMVDLGPNNRLTIISGDEEGYDSRNHRIDYVGEGAYKARFRDIDPIAAYQDSRISPPDKEHPGYISTPGWDWEDYKGPHVSAKTFVEQNQNKTFPARSELPWVDVNHINKINYYTDPSVIRWEVRF